MDDNVIDDTEKMSLIVALLQNMSIVSAGKVSLVSARQADTIYTI
jgi:hypothetical protein